ncbi:hypothetical protein OG895_17400 [Streptomyces sp. NBC_00201]|uniref:hypothetical protein n=1 Tax=Streptomyces sp. NBC_00201 TaxID=2975679 RepID=UPI00224CA876|nr:hypothetical protein [Streptomyces sp. NBC_00201]MCX5246986.1 hypothetical protein [Streptomyces sp. NBC_00201]
MSNDYAAIVSTLDVAVLLVGAVQFAKVWARIGDETAAQAQTRRERMGALIEQQRQGVEPSRSELLEVRRTSLVRWFRQLALLHTAGLIWFFTCGNLIVVQLRVLRWAGTAGAGPNPDLAQDAFNWVAIGVVLLFIEGYVGGFVRARRKAQQARKAYSLHYTNEERIGLDQKVREAARSESAPSAAPADT